MKASLRPIKAPPLFDERRFRASMENAGEMAAKSILIDYRVTHQTWKTNPQFRIERKAAFEWHIFTDNAIYGYVNEGTRPHEIRPKNPAGLLAFQTGYTAKTVPRVIMSRQGGASGPTVTAKVVQHPGFPGREFDEVIGEKWDREWPKQVETALVSALWI